MSPIPHRASKWKTPDINVKLEGDAGKTGNDTHNIDTAPMDSNRSAGIVVRSFPPMSLQNRMNGVGGRRRNAVKSVSNM